MECQKKKEAEGKEKETCSESLEESNRRTMYTKCVRGGGLHACERAWWGIVRTKGTQGFSPGTLPGKPEVLRKSET